MRHQPVDEFGLDRLQGLERRTAQNRGAQELLLDEILTVDEVVAKTAKAVRVVLG